MNKIKVMTVVGTRPEIIKLSQVIKELDINVDHTIVHTGQNYDYELNELFFEQLGIRKPDIFLDAIKGIDNATEQATAFTNFNAWVDNQTRGKLPEPFATTVCGPIGTLTDYLSDLALNIAELGKTVSLSGDNTKVIDKADNSTKELMKAVYCAE